MRFSPKIAILLTSGLIMFTLILRSNVTEFESDLLLQKINVAETENGLVKIYWDLTGMKQEDPRLIEFIKNNVLIKPDFSVPLNLSKHTKCCKKLGGQFGQAFEAEDMLGLKNTQKDTKGFFIEAGAVDGEYLSNTLFFEMKYDWTGLLVEPNPAQLKELYTKHRKAYILPHCLSTKTEVEIVTFEVSDVLSGIMLDGKVRPSRIDDPNPGRSDKKYERKIQVQCFPLYSVLMAIGNPHIDYFSLDIEGAELVMLKTLPWNKISMTLIDVEVNHAGAIFPGTRNDIQNFLSSHGYPFTKSVKIDDLFYNKANNRFL